MEHGTDVTDALAGSTLMADDDQYIGCTVLVFWPEEEQWFEGKIQGRASEGLVVQYDDGDTGVVGAVTANPHLKVLGPARDGDLRPGDHVKGLFDDGEWYRGTVEHANASEGGFDVRFDDGDFRAAVPTQEIKRFSTVVASNTKSSSSSSNNNNSTLLLLLFILLQRRAEDP